jgi:hypothetical protein
MGWPTFETSFPSTHVTLGITWVHGLSYIKFNLNISFQKLTLLTHYICYSKI